MKKKYNGKKNRSIEESEGLSPPKAKLTRNSAKRSKREALSRETTESKVQEDTTQ